MLFKTSSASSAKTKGDEEKQEGKGPIERAACWISNN